MIQVAIEAVKKAGNFMQSQYTSVHRVEYKDGQEIVTEIDKQSEKIIRNVIHTMFPEHSILGEESCLDGTDKDNIWIVDPLEGTENYSRGIGWYGISLAFSRRNIVLIGVVYNPVTNELFIAEKGKGAYKNDKNIYVSTQSDLQQSVVYVSGNKKSKILVPLLVKGIRHLRIASAAAYETCMIADGRIEGFIKITKSPWGFAAANLIVEEAGGKVTTFNGSAWDTTSTHLIASNGHLHDKLMTLVSKQISNFK